MNFMLNLDSLSIVNPVDMHICVQWVNTAKVNKSHEWNVLWKYKE